MYQFFFSVFAAVSLLCGHTIIVVEGASQYDSFQALAFSVYTGPAALCISPSGKNTTEDGDTNVFRSLIEDDAQQQDDDDDIIEPSLSCYDALYSDCSGSKRVTFSITDLFNETESFDLCFDYLNPDCGCSIDEDNGKGYCESGLGYSKTESYTTDDMIVEKVLLRCYVGKTLETEDASGRVQIMEDAIDKAYEMSDYKNDSSVLKIFNAPEFFFRGHDGAYKMTATTWNESAIFSIGDDLTQYVLDEKFKDFLFVFGTIVSTSTDNDITDGIQEYQNFALIVKGGSNGGRFLVPKRYVSPIDFLSGNDRVENPYETHLSYSTTIFVQIGNQLKNDYNFSVVDSNWLMNDDILFSVEICLDHANKQALIHSTPTPDTSKSVRYGTDPQFLAQISLVTSAGMEVTTDSLVLVPNGSIFLQDGLNTGANQVLSCYPINDPFTGDEIDVKWNTDCAEKPQKFLVPTTTLPLFKTSEYESDEAALFKSLFSVYGQAFGMNLLPTISVYKPIPIAPRSTSSKSGGSILQCGWLLMSMLVVVSFNLL